MLVMGRQGEGEHGDWEEVTEGRQLIGLGKCVMNLPTSLERKGRLRAKKEDNFGLSERCGHVSRRTVGRVSGNAG
jgi:hypothetical protein